MSTTKKRAKVYRVENILGDLYRLFYAENGQPMSCLLNKIKEDSTSVYTLADSSVKLPKLVISQARRYHGVEIKVPFN